MLRLLFCLTEGEMKDMDIKTVNNGFYEYVVYQVIEDLNEQIDMRVSDGQILRDEIFQRVNQKLQQDNVTPAMQLMVDSIQGGVFDLYGLNASVQSVDDLKLLREPFKKALDSGYVPLSPYIPAIRHYGSVKENGAKLMAIAVNDIDKHFNGNFDSFLNKDNHHYRQKLQVGNWENGSFEKRGDLASLTDMSGLSRLMEYMSESEFKDVQGWVTSVGIQDPSRFMSPQTIDRSIAILEYLRQNGYSYSVVADTNPGQLKAQVEGTKLSVRIMDERKNDSYVGRIYDDGTQIYYSTNFKERGSNVQSAYTNQTKEDAVNLVRFALGENVERIGFSGLVGSAGVRQGLRNKVNMSYTSNGNFNATYRPYYHRGQSTDAVVSMYRKSSRSSHTRFFEDGAAEIFLFDAVTSARKNYEERLNVNGLIEQFEKYGMDENYMPDLSQNPEIAGVQKGYWDLLKGHSVYLLKPGVALDNYLEQVETTGELSNEEASDILTSLRYEGDAQEQIKQHLNDLVNVNIGQYKVSEDGLRFDAVNVARFMDGVNDQFTNQASLVEAIRRLNIPYEQLRGSTFTHMMLGNDLLRFDVSTAKKMNEIDNLFVKEMFEVVRESLASNGCIVNDDDILFDANGMIRYTGRSVVKLSKDKGDDTKVITGEIGQIFVPDEQGVIRTKYAASPNYLAAPGYEAYIVPQQRGEHLTVEERTRLKGYKEVMKDTIRYQLRKDLTKGGDTIYSPTSLNSVYRRLYDTRHDLEFFERSAEDGLSESWQNAIIETEARRVKYNNDIKQYSTINADYMHQMNKDNMDYRNDNFYDPFRLTDYRNMAIMTQEGDGYFDPIVTGGATNQGTVRFLTKDAVVRKDGSIQRGALDGRTPLAMHADVVFSKYNPYDRQQMTASNLMQASSISEPVKVMNITLGGWSMDDGIIVSKSFAEKHQIRNADGKLRNLVIGDKLSDLHGNKGVISYVVDPGMSVDEAEKQGVTKLVEYFRLNPDVSVAMAPFPSVSRFNGGSTRELMQNTSDLKHIDGRVVSGGIGEARFIVTHMAVDAKTKIYDDAALAEGRGRKASGQLAWALASHGAENVMREMYGSNSGSLQNLREMLITMGLDMDEYGNFRTEYQPHYGEKRELFTLPDLEYTATGKVDLGKMKAHFKEMISDKGGFMELPFELEFPTSVLGEDFKGSHKTPELSVDERSFAEYPSYCLPVLSAYLRSGHRFDDGSISTHAYSNHYINIYEKAVQAMAIQDEMGVEGADKALLSTRFKECQREAQVSFNRITKDLERRQFSGKHNIIRDGIMANRLPNSATAVWTADPRLDVDQVKIGKAMAEAIGVVDDDYVLLWRDPMLRDGGVRGMKVVISDEITGIAINPVMDKCFDGDFDGDSIGVWKPNSKGAIKDVKQLLSVQANLLDYGNKDPETGLHPLFLQDSLDVKVGQYVDPILKMRFDELTKRVNSFEEAYKNGSLSDKAVWQERNNATKELSDYYRDAFDASYGMACVSYHTMKDHIKSVQEACIDTGAKGSVGKLRAYMRYLGVSDGLDSGDIDYTNLQDLGDTIATRQDNEDTEYATAVKSFGTGVAGMYSQRGISVLRNQAPKAVLELTYVATQSILQAKHDPVEAAHKYRLLMSTMRHVWSGVKMESSYDGDMTVWSPVTQNGQNVQATKDEWIAQTIKIYRHPDGMNVAINNDYVAEIAELLQKDGVMIPLETEGKMLYASPMDKLAYGGSFKDYVLMAQDGQNLFDGVNNKLFAPHIIRENQRDLESCQEFGLEMLATPTSLMKSDMKDKVKVVQSSVEAVGRKYVVNMIEDVKDEKDCDISADF